MMGMQFLPLPMTARTTTTTTTTSAGCECSSCRTFKAYCLRVETTSKESESIIIPPHSGAGSSTGGGDRRSRSLFVLLPVPRSSTIIATEVTSVNCAKDASDRRNFGVTLVHRAVDVVDVLLCMSNADESNVRNISTNSTNRSNSGTSSEGLRPYLSRIVGSDRHMSLACFEFSSSGSGSGSGSSSSDGGSGGGSGGPNNHHTQVWCHSDGELLRLSTTGGKGDGAQCSPQSTAATSPGVVLGGHHQGNSEPSINLVTTLLHHPLVIKHKDNFITSAWQETLGWLADKAAAGIDLKPRDGVQFIPRSGLHLSPEELDFKPRERERDRDREASAVEDKGKEEEKVLTSPSANVSRASSVDDRENTEQEQKVREGEGEVGGGGEGEGAMPSSEGESGSTSTGEHPAPPSPPPTPVPPRIVAILRALALLSSESCQVMEEELPLAAIQDRGGQGQGQEGEEKEEEEAITASAYSDLVVQAASDESDNVAVLAEDSKERERGVAIASLHDLQYSTQGGKKGKDSGMRGLQIVFDAGPGKVGIFTLVLDCGPRGQQLISPAFPASSQQNLKVWLTIGAPGTESRFNRRDLVVDACNHHVGTAHYQRSSPSSSSLFTASARPAPVRLKVKPMSLSDTSTSSNNDTNNRRLVAQMVDSTIAPLLQWRIARAGQIKLLSALQETVATIPRPGVARIVFTQPQHAQYLQCLQSCEKSVPCMPCLTVTREEEKPPQIYALHPLCTGYLELVGSSVDHLQLLTGILSAAFSELGWTVHLVPVITSAWEEGKVVDPLTHEEVDSREMNSEEKKERKEGELMTLQDPHAPTVEEHRRLDVTAHRIVILGHNPAACVCINIKADENIFVKRPTKRVLGKGESASKAPTPVEFAAITGATVTTIKCTSSGLGCHAHRLRAEFVHNVNEAVMELGEALYEGKYALGIGEFAFE